MPRKRLLIIRCSDDVQACEIGNVMELAQTYDMSVHLEDFHLIDDLADFYENRPRDYYDFVYLCGHGCPTTFGGSGKDHDRDLAIPWPLLSWTICDTLRDNSLLFLACCDAGMETVASDFFIGCEFLDRVFGPASSAHGHSLLLAFHVLVHDAIHNPDSNVISSAAIATMVTTDKNLLGYTREAKIAEPTHQIYEAEGFVTKYSGYFAGLPAEESQFIEDRFENFVTQWELDGRIAQPVA